MSGSIPLFQTETALRNPASMEARLAVYQGRVWPGMLVFTYIYAFLGSGITVYQDRRPQILLLSAKLYLTVVIFVVVAHSLAAAFLIAKDAPWKKTFWRNFRTQALFLVPPLVLFGGYTAGADWKPLFFVNALVIAFLSWLAYRLLRDVPEP